MFKAVARSSVQIFFWPINTPKKLRRWGELIFRVLGRRKTGGASAPPDRVAVIKMDGLGDVVLCSRLLADLRRTWPRARITLFVREWLVDFARLCPDVDEVIGVPLYVGAMQYDHRFDHYPIWGKPLLAWLRFCYRHGLWTRPFDVVLVPRWATDIFGATALAYVIGAPRRWGVTEKAMEGKASQNKGFDLLLTDVVSGSTAHHEVELNDTFLAAMGINVSGTRKLVFWGTAADREKAAQQIQAAGANAAKPWVLLCMGAGVAKRMWPVEAYAELCAAVFDLDKVQLLTFGSAKEKPLGLKLAKILGRAVINLEDAIPMNLLPSAVACTAVYVGSDTGTMHLAATANLPVLEISCHPLDGDPEWGNSPLRFGPWAVPNRIVQPATAMPPCGAYCDAGEAHCILGVSVEAAARALRSLLEEVGHGAWLKAGGDQGG